MKNLLITLTILAGIQAVACYSDIECGMGSKCVQTGGFGSQGVCIGGLNRDNGYGVRQGLPDSMIPSNGQRCQADFQCGFGGTCIGGLCR